MHGWWAISYIALWFLVVALSLLVVALARQVGTLHLRLGPRGALEVDDEGPPLGQAPPPVDAFDLSGRPVKVGGPGGGQLVLFVSPGCPVCREVLPSVAPVAAAGSLQALVVTDTDGEEVEESYRHARVAVPVIAEPGIARSYGVPGTPYAVVLDPTGVVRAKGTVNNLEQLEGLVDTAGRRTHEAHHGEQARAG
jgi:methylamine dehydrogenase accessory protein MauD